MTSHRPSRAEIQADMDRIIAESEKAKAKASEDAGFGECPMCEREMPLTAHHLIPRTTHKKFLKKGFDKDELNTCVNICRPCHSGLHNTYDEMTLAKDFNTLEKLMEDERIQRMVAYNAKQPTVTRDEVMRRGFRFKR